MALLGISLIVCILLGVLALRANARFRTVDRLPMQWWFTGEVTWFAPRPPALALIPGLAACTFVGLWLLALNVRPRAGQENMVIPTFIGIGVMFLAIQLLHFWLIAKALRRSGS